MWLGRNIIFFTCHPARDKLLVCMYVIEDKNFSKPVQSPFKITFLVFGGEVVSTPVQSPPEITCFVCLFCL